MLLRSLHSRMKIEQRAQGSWHLMVGHFWMLLFPRHTIRWTSPFSFLVLILFLDQTQILQNATWPPPSWWLMTPARWLMRNPAVLSAMFLVHASSKAERSLHLSRNGSSPVLVPVNHAMNCSLHYDRMKDVQLFVRSWWVTINGLEETGGSKCSNK